MKEKKIKNIKSKVMFATSISLLTLASLVSVNFWPVACLAFVSLNVTISIVFYFTHKDSVKANKNDTLKYLLLINILLLGYSIFNINRNINIDEADELTIARMNGSRHKPATEIKSSNESDEVARIKNLSVSEMMDELRTKVDSKISRQDLELYMKGLEREVYSRIVATSSKSYKDMGTIYEAAYVLGITRDKDLALSNYVQALNISDKKSEDYAVVARFIALDKKDKEDAIKFAQKALDLSRTQKDKASYQKLLEYIKSL